MCHIGAAPGDLADLLDLAAARATSSPTPTRAPATTRCRTASCCRRRSAAKQRGVIIDVGHGGGSFDFTVCEPAMQQGMAPDTISSDIHSVSINTPGYPTLPWVMSKFLALGMPLEERRRPGDACEPAKVIGRVPGLGTLQVGAPADLAIMDLVDGPSSSSTRATTSARASESWCPTSPSGVDGPSAGRRCRRRSCIELDAEDQGRATGSGGSRA